MVSQKKISWEISEDKKELVITVRVAMDALVDVLLLQYSTGTETHEKILEMALKVLSYRERQILPMLLKGLAYKDIMKELNISNSTAKQHASSIYRKLHVSGRGELLGLRLSARTRAGEN